VLKIAVITGSTRPERRTAVAAAWTLAKVREHPAVTAGEAEVDPVDLADVGLPLLDEPVPAAFGVYEHEHTRRWSRIVSAYDAFIFVTPEYNHSMPAALKNALDYLYAEWFHKAAAFVSHGVNGGVRSVEHLRHVMAELRLTTVSPQVALSAFTDFRLDNPTQPGEIAPADHHEVLLREMVDELVPLARALQERRTREAAHLSDA
jgi:NAD(P)H-dependent FMN reductase